MRPYPGSSFEGRLIRTGAALAILLASSLVGGEEPKGEEKVQVDRARRRVEVPAVVLEQGKYEEQLKGAIEYVLVSEGGKSYESLFETRSTPVEIARAFEELGLPPGRLGAAEEAPRGAAFRIRVEYEAGGKRETRPVEAFILHAKEGKPLSGEAWTFTGSMLHRDPAREAPVLKCSTTRSIVGLHFQDDSPLLLNGRKEAWNQNIYKALRESLPPKGTPVRVVFEQVPGKAPEDVRGAHAVVSGRVQGLGVPAFAQREARKLSLGGFVRSLPDGRIEVAVEGRGDDVAKFLQKLEQGPRGARPEKVDARDVTALGIYKDFEIEDTRRN
jgi:acylphosphatase